MAEASGSVVLDANLLVLLVVGSADPGLVKSHKRLQPFSAADYNAVGYLVGEFERHLLLPNVVTEVANIAHWGIVGPARRRITDALATLVASETEHYVPSVIGVRRAEFTELGLTDSLLMHFLEFGSGDGLPTLLTVDAPLHARALAAGLSVIDYMQLR